MLIESIPLVILGAPALAALVLALVGWFGIHASERLVVRVVGAAFASSAIACLVLAILMLASGLSSVESHPGEWFRVGHYAFGWGLVCDRLSLPFATFSAVLVGVVAAFSRRYLHQEPGFFRFYLLLALFGASVELVVLAGSLDLVFFGWEIVGMTSALLIAYFHERRKPVEHGFRAFITYRFCDVGLLAAAVWLHHVMGSSRVVANAGGELWSGFPTPPGTFDAALIGLLLLWASMGKAAQAPLGGWLPRAMEGPTPSSAIFYGAISVHLGPYLLLRAAPILDASPVVAWTVVAVGTVTALHATVVGRAQTDIKCALAYASMTQIGLIYIEIGLGLRFVALAHIVGHATIRSLEILRSPSLLHDHHHLEQAMGSVLPRTGVHLERLVPRRLQIWLYRHAYERGYSDSFLRYHVVGGYVRVLRWIDAIDSAWTSLLANDRRQENRAPGKNEGEEPQ